MKKCVFIVEDQLKDLGGFFYSLNDLLLDAPTVGGAPLSSTDLKLFFLHIRWDTEDPKEEKEEFDRKMEEVGAQVKERMDRTAIEVEYCAVQQESAQYIPENCEECSRRILEKIRELLIRELGHDEEFPDAGEPCYAVLMDVILNSAKDLESIKKGEKILSSWLYRQLGSSRCIVYSEYPSTDVCTKWKNVTEMHEEIVERVLIARSRAIYVPLERRMYQILGLETAEE